MAFADWVKNDLDFGDLVLGSFKIIKLRLSHFILIFLLVELIGSFLSSYYLGKTEVWNVYLAIGSSFLVNFLFSCLAGIMLTLMVDGFVTGKSISFAEMLVKAIRLLPIVLLSSIIVGVLVLFGTVMLIVPGVVIAVYFSFYINAIVLRQKGLIDALKYSYGLVKGSWWIVFGVVFLLFLLVFVMVLITELTLKETSFSFISNIIQSLISSFTYVLLTIFFLNLEARQKKGAVESNA